MHAPGRRTHGRYVCLVSVRSERAGRGPVPREVRIASALLTALGAVLTVNAVIAMLYRDDLQAAAQEDVGSLLPPDQVSTILVVFAALLIVLGGVLLLAGAQIRRGRQWARVLAFVGSGILILFTGIAAMAGAGLLAVALLRASVGVVALLMQSAVADFFERAVPYRQPRP